MRKNDFINAPEISETKNTKINVIGIIIFLVLAVYLFKLFSMQVVQGQNYRTQSKKISSTVKEIASFGGDIEQCVPDFAVPLIYDKFK